MFTKNWINNKTRQYTLSQEPGLHEAKLIAEFEVDGLITDADYNSNTGHVALLGYENKGISSESFIWYLWEYPTERFFEGKKSKIRLGIPVVLGQNKGIVLIEGYKG